jgi:hypothetical protein
MLRAAHIKAGTPGAQPGSLHQSGVEMSRPFNMIRYIKQQLG